MSKSEQKELLKIRYENYKKATFEEFVDYEAERHMKFASKLQELKKRLENYLLVCDVGQYLEQEDWNNIFNEIFEEELKQECGEER